MRDLPTTAAIAAQVSYELGSVPGQQEYLRAAGQTLLSLIGGDAAGWNLIDLPARRAELFLYPEDPVHHRSMEDRLTATADDHPLVVSYLRSPLDVTPRRLSDVCSRRELLGTRTYAELLRPMGARHQLTVVTGPMANAVGRGWAINRSGADFTERELEIASQLQPLLRILDQAAGRREVPAHGRIAELAAQVRLTEREREVLWWLSQGLTAGAIGHRLRISSGTVRKHLENAYGKLECHDRLMAVQRARELGLLDTMRRAARL